jgi:tRNA U38,U39,U40 pseudouridine synthase TruA
MKKYLAVPVAVLAAISVAAPTAALANIAQDNAVEAAHNYLSFDAFSQKGLIQQLSSKFGDGYPKAVAVWAVDHIHVNWYKQAVKSARSYLQTSSFSKSGLYQQLSSSYGEGFTPAQAQYAVNRVYR